MVSNLSVKMQAVEQVYPSIIEFLSSNDSAWYSTWEFVAHKRSREQTHLLTGKRSFSFSLSLLLDGNMNPAQTFSSLRR